MSLIGKINDQLYQTLNVVPLPATSGSTSVSYLSRLSFTIRSNNAVFQCLNIFKKEREKDRHKEEEINKRKEKEEREKNSCAFIS